MPSFDDIVNTKISDYESLAESESGRNDDRFIALFSLYALRDFKSGGSGGGDLTTWSGSTNLSTLGTVSTGTWNANTIGVQYGGTGLTFLGTSNQQLRVNALGTGLEYFTPSGDSSTLNNQAPSYYLSRSNHTGTQSWSTLTSTPTTLSGYGITDAVSSTGLTAWTGSTNITTVGNISTGTWNGTTIATNKGGTGLSSIGTALQQIRVNAAGTGLEYFTASTDASTLNNQNAAFYLNRTNHTGTQAWSTITGTPTTLSGYGITDGVSSSTLAAWAGSTNITTLGTISTGTWDGSPISTNKGGTGLTTLGLSGQSIRVNATGTGFEFYTPSTGGGSLPSLNAAQIWIGDSTNTAVSRTLSGAITVSDTGVVSLGSRVVSNDAIRSGAACSVIGRATGTLGQVNDIAASTNYTVLRRAGSANLAFGSLDFNYLTASANTLIGCGTTAGITQEIPCTAFARSLLDDSDAATARATLAISPNTGSVCDGRLTLTSGVPNTAGTNVVNATTIYFTPYIGNLVSLWSSTESRWIIYPFTELSLSLAGTSANTNYDVFLFDNAGTLTLEWVAWLNDTTRATSITRLNGTWVKSTDNRRYLGSFRTTSAGMTEVSETGTPKCFIQNALNRIRISLFRSEPATSWTYTGTSFRPTNNNLLNRVEVINGNESSIVAHYQQHAGDEMNFRTGIGLNSTTTNSSQLPPILFSALGGISTGTAVLDMSLPVGYNYLQMLERFVNGNVDFAYEGRMLVSYWA